MKILDLSEDFMKSQRDTDIESNGLGMGFDCWLHTLRDWAFCRFRRQESWDERYLLGSSLSFLFTVKHYLVNRFLKQWLEYFYVGSSNLFVHHEIMLDMLFFQQNKITEHYCRDGSKLESESKDCLFEYLPNWILLRGRRKFALFVIPGWRNHKVSL